MMTTRKIQIDAVEVHVARDAVEDAVKEWALQKASHGGVKFTGHAIAEADKFGGFKVTILKGSAD